MKRREIIGNFLLKYMCLEGAIEHFGATLPKDNSDIVEIHERIFNDKPEGRENGYPLKWCEKELVYKSKNVLGNTNCEKCWSCLKRIRNNLFHCNKAREPDKDERLDFLLNWSHLFMDELLKEESEISVYSNKIKKILEI